MRVWVKIKPPGIGPQVLVVGSIYQGLRHFGYPFLTHSHVKPRGTFTWLPTMACLEALGALTKRATGLDSSWSLHRFIAQDISVWPQVS